MGQKVKQTFIFEYADNVSTICHYYFLVSEIASNMSNESTLDKKKPSNVKLATCLHYYCIHLGSFVKNNAKPLKRSRQFRLF